MKPIQITGFQAPAVVVDQAAITTRDSLLEESTVFVEIADSSDFALAGPIVASLKEIEREVEKHRKSIKAPVLELGKAIDEAAAKYLKPIQVESQRLGALIAGYELAQRRIREEAIRKAEAEARRLEQERIAREQAEARKLAEAQAAEAKAAREAAEIADAPRRAEAERLAREAAEARRKVEEEAARARLAEAQARMQAPTPVLPRAPEKIAGLRVREVQMHEVTDVLELFKSRPDLVKLVPIAGEINKALEAGDTLPGVRAWKESRA